ncbi:unnamed protein product [Urochloa decumbens]|uniref:Embryo sac development arrest 6 n=1 Tax=Urochloa decumbens TaxID=240449 RepID=A0ABC9EJ82_9POAL
MQVPRGGGGFLGKRKEREYYPPYPSASSSEQALLLQRPPPFTRPDPRVLGFRPDRAAALRLGALAKPPLPHQGAAAGPHAIGGGNKLLAGYLAHEFLRCGTLLGERRLEPQARKEKELAAVPAPEPSRRYAEVSRLLMAGGARIPGVVNPSQLGRWLRIKD